MVITDYQNLPHLMDFPVDFLEQTSVLLPISQQTKVDTCFPPNTEYSPNNNSLSSNQSCVYDDSGISSVVTLPNEADNCMDSINQINAIKNNLLEDFEPMMRGRSSTLPSSWPRRRPNPQPNNLQLLVQERIAEDRELLYNSQNVSQSSIHLTQGPSMNNQVNNTNQCSNQMTYSNSPEQDMNYKLPTNYSNENSGDEGKEFADSAVKKRSITRRNAWGDLSYADLITQAILNSPEQRLTLSEIYDFMVENVPYFSDKGDSNSSAGWKNSVRHNLSLHNQFVRIQNEARGKSSWWAINPEAKTKNSPGRRRATIDSSMKHILDKKRRGARKRVEMQHTANSTLVHPCKRSQLKSYSDLANVESENDANYVVFRPRAFSNVLAPDDRSQISPTFTPNNEEFAYQSWAPTVPYKNSMNEIMNQTDQICLGSDDDDNQMGDPQQFGVYSTVPQQIQPNFQVKQEEIKPQFQENIYQELKVVSGVNQQTQSNQFQQQQVPQFTQSNQPQQQTNLDYAFGCNRLVNQQQFIQTAPNTLLTKDLENLNTFVPPGCELDDINEIIQQELSTSNNVQFGF